MNYVVDIDGVVADGSRRVLGPINGFYATVHRDEPIWPMIHMVASLMRTGANITFVTNRPKIVRDVTEEWLDQFFEHGAYALVCTSSIDRGYMAKLKAIQSLPFVPDIIIEDDPIVAEYLYENGYRVLLFRNTPEWDAARKEAYMKLFPHDYHEVVIP